MKERLQFETLLADISANFVNLPSDRVDDEIQNAQRLICEYLKMGHSSIWQGSPEKPGSLRLTHINRDPVLPSPPLDSIGEEYWPWVVRKMMENQVLCLPDTEEAPPEAAVDIESWRRFKVRSALIIPLSVGGHTPVGALAFSDPVAEERNWPEPLKKRLRLIAQVFANALDRKRIEQKLLESEARLSLAANSAGVGFWTLDPVNCILWTTAKLKELFGLRPEDELDYQTFFQMLHPEDTDRVRNVIADAMATGAEANVEYRIVRRDGTVHFLVARGNRHTYTHDRPYILTGVVIDNTELKRAEQERVEFTHRLLDAQEAERSRIARELHDDIGQSLALLCVRIKDAMSEPYESIGQELKTISQEAKSVAGRISQVSHQLHSSALEYLGLRTAVESTCREFGVSYHIPIDCICHDVPAKVDERTSLSFYRVLQEALHNAAKHSGATEIDVHLERAGEDLRLCITDNGKGFDIESGTRCIGLGLRSMRERIQAIGGQFEIQSSPGRGTKLCAHARIAN